MGPVSMRCVPVFVGRAPCTYKVIFLGCAFVGAKEHVERAGSSSALV